MALCLTALAGKAAAQRFFTQASYRFGFPMQFGHRLVVDHYPLFDAYQNYYYTPPAQLKAASLGAGEQLQLCAGVRFSDNWVVEVGYNKNASPKRYEATRYAWWGENRSEVYAPAFSCLTVGARWISPEVPEFSARVGLLLPLQRQVMTQSWASRDTFSIYQEKKLSTAYNVGVQFGVQYARKLIGPVSFQARADVQWISFRATRSEVMTYRLNGEEGVTGLPESARVVDYMSGVSQRSNLEDQPSTGPAFRVPFSSFGLSVGLIVALGKDADQYGAP